jgi:hypothetical protein
MGTGHRNIFIRTLKFYKTLYRQIFEYCYRIFEYELLTILTSLKTMYILNEIRVRIGPLHPFVCRKRRLNGAVRRMRSKKPRPRAYILQPFLGSSGISIYVINSWKGCKALNKQTNILTVLCIVSCCWIIKVFTTCSILSHTRDDLVVSDF